MIKTTTWLILLMSLSIANLAFGAPARSSTVVLLAEGTDVDVQRELSDFAPTGVTLQTPERLTAAVAGQGVRGSIGEALVNPRTRKQTILAVRNAMGEVGASAVLSVQLKRSQGGKEMHVILILPSQAEPMVEEDIALARRERAAARLTPLVSGALQDLEPPPRATSDAAEPAPAPRRAPAVEKGRSGEKVSKRSRKKRVSRDEVEPAEEDESVPPPDEKDAVSKKREKLHHSNAMVVADLGVGMASRRLEYNTPVAGPLREYAAPFIGVYSIGAEIYPAAGSGIGVAKDIGVVGRFANSLPVNSTADDGSGTARGSFMRYAVGLRGRILTGDKKNSPLIGLEGTYGVWSFAFSGLDQVVTDAVLGVEYKHLRAGADVRVPFGEFSLLGGLGYMNISSAGAYTERFPRATVAGVDAMIGGAYAVASFIDLRARLGYTRIFSSANPELDAPYVAGGALDQYLSFNLGASAIF